MESGLCLTPLLMLRAAPSPFLTGGGIATLLLVMQPVLALRWCFGIEWLVLSPSMLSTVPAAPAPELDLLLTFAVALVRARSMRSSALAATLASSCLSTHWFVFELLSRLLVGPLLHLVCCSDPLPRLPVGLLLRLGGFNFDKKPLFVRLFLRVFWLLSHCMEWRSGCGEAIVGMFILNKHT